jgi:hypothetical protein
MTEFQFGVWLNESCDKTTTGCRPFCSALDRGWSMAHHTSPRLIVTASADQGGLQIDIPGKIVVRKRHRRSCVGVTLIGDYRRSSWFVRASAELVSVERGLATIANARSLVINHGSTETSSSITTHRSIEHEKAAKRRRSKAVDVSPRIAVNRGRKAA